MKTVYDIDSDNQSITIKHQFLNSNHQPPVTLPMDEYLSIRYHENEKKNWRNYINKKLFTKSQAMQGGGRGLGIDIPIPIKSQAFQKIFGSNSIGLQVIGNVTIDGGLRHEKRSEVKTAINRQSNYNFKMKQTQRFTVKGNVGEKVNVFVDQDSERPFEFDNAIRLEYKGFEDEVIESIEAGNVSLNLPSSRFVTFSAKNSGLFGIKANMRLGNLKVTTIASQEKGQKKKLSISGGATEEESRIDDYNYRKGTYFFLNLNFRQNYTNTDADGTHQYNPVNSITDIELYKSGDGYFNQADAIYGWAIAQPEGTNPASPDTGEVDQNHYKGYFLRLEQNDDYFIDKDLGYIAMEQPIREGEVLAVAYRDSSGNIIGDIGYEVTQEKKPIILQMLRTKKPIASDYTWDLEWKNVYYLGSRNIDKNGFDLKIYFKPSSGDPQETVDRNRTPVSYLQVLGLDRRDLNGNPTPDNILDDDPNIINWARGEIIFPDLEPFKFEKWKDEDEGFYNQQLASKRVDAMYDTTDFNYITQHSNFYISSSAKIRQANYSLGFNVIEGSEQVVLDGSTLQSGRDYIIDYFTGNLTILDERATDPNASLDITYESNQLFQINRKTMFGTRWDYELFNNSFIGGTFLYLNQSTLDQKVRIGQDGPMQNFVWNLNTALNFEPYFITKGLNSLPFIQTKDPTTINLEGEIAEIVPNPNSRDNPATGDQNGVVYVDDFEAAKRETPLGVMRRQWTKSSIPKVLPNYPFATEDEIIGSRGRLIWYNPYEQVAIREIWPNRDVNANVPQRVHVLTLRFARDNTSILGPQASWAGLMRYLSAGYADQTNSKFLEVWVRGNEGKLHFDFGQISEDAIPNKRLDTEDKLRGGIRNNILDDDEDTGLDGVFGKDGTNVPGDDGDDDWSYISGGYDYNHINGTEGNANDEGGRYPDTEDLNGNGDVDLRNDYFEYSFSLNKDDPDTALIQGGLGLSPDEDYGWRMYRIPLFEPDTVIGNPQWTNIEYVRIWMDGSPRDTIYTSIAEVNLVGSEWKERGIAATNADTSFYDAKDDSTIRVSVVNSYDNPDYRPPPGVVGETDQITKVVRNEQALRIVVTGLPAGYNGIVQKSFFQSQSYIDYKQMKMFVYGLDKFYSHIQADSSSIEMFFRFGSDDRNYYEFREKVYQGWHSKNEMIIDFEELTGLKNKTGSEFIDAEGNKFMIVSEDGDMLRVVGKPSLTNIRQLTLGVINLSDIPFDGEVWLNELRLTDVKKDRGKAMRVRSQIDLAGLVNMNAEINRIDDDFRTVNERFGKGNNQFRGSFNANFNVNKFFPGLGVSMPISIGYQNSESTPKYFPGSDIIVSKKTANDSLLETIRTRNTRKSLSVSFRKSNQSRNPFIKYTLDGLSLSYSYSESFMSNSIVKESRNFSYSGNLGYGVTINSKANLKPFGWLGDGPIIGALSGIQLFYLPNRINYKISFSRVQDNTLNRNGLITPRYSFVINQDFSTGFQPFNSLTVDYTRAHVNDLRNIQDPYEILNVGLGPLTSLRQSINIKYAPRISSWLSLNLSANTSFNYNNNIQQAFGGKSATNNLTYNTSVTFTPQNFIQMFKKRKSTPRTPRTRVPPRRPEKKEGEGEEKPKEKKEDEGKKLSNINPLKLFSFIGDKIQPINLRYSQRISSNSYGLERIPSFDFQIGKTFYPGPVQQNVGSNRGSFNRGYNVNAQTGLNITRQLSVSFNYDYNNSWNRTTNTTGSVSDTRWRFKGNDMLFPNWTLKWSGLEKLPLLNKIAQRASLDHGRTGRFDSRWQKTADNVTTETFNTNYRPFLGLNVTLKNGMSLNIQYNISSSETINKTSGSSGTRKSNTDLNATLNYSRQGGFALPLPFLKNKVIKNNIDLSMTFVKSSDVSEQKRGGSYQEWTRTEKWSLLPRLTYSFSSTVRGGVHFEFGKTKNKLYGDTRITEFGINVNIQISGR